MRNDLVKTTIQNLLDQFARQDFPNEIGWQIIRKQSGLHAVPSDAWSPGNRWIMLACGTTDARGFGQWHQAGRRVKPGSKALYICAPNTRKITSDNNDDPEAARTIIAGFRWIPVFCLSDTTGQPVPYLQAKLEEDTAAERKRLAENRIKEVMKEHERSTSPGGKQVTWKTVQSSRIDSARLKKEEPALYEKFATTSATRRFSVSEGK